MTILVGAQVNRGPTCRGGRRFPQAVHFRSLAVMSAVWQTTTTTSGRTCGLLPQKDIVTGGAAGLAA